MPLAFCRFAALGFALVLGGCDIMYGVSRGAELDHAPDLDCVRHAVETAPGVTATRVDSEHDGKGLFHPTPWVYNYVFSGTKIWGALQLYKEYDGRFTYQDGLMQLNSKPPQDVIDATRPVMRAIELKLGSDCGVPELPARVTEYCSGVVCTPLSTP